MLFWLLLSVTFAEYVATTTQNGIKFVYKLDECISSTSTSTKYIKSESQLNICTYSTTDCTGEESCSLASSVFEFLSSLPTDYVAKISYSKDFTQII